MSSARWTCVVDLPGSTAHLADSALLERARRGDSDAFGELYAREVDAARRLARILVGEQGVDELVAESFARVLTQLQAGRGPTEDFRAYLHVTIRNGFRDGLRATKESPSSDQPWLLDDVLPPVEELVEDLDREVAVTALATLPKSWQEVLWHLEVEGRKPAEVATILDLDAPAVSSLAYRAREGLKRAYLDQQFRAVAGGQCGWTQSRMSQYVRDDLSPRARQKVADHLAGCSACATAYASVDRVNQKLAVWLFPVVLWGAVSAEKGGLAWLAGAGAAGAGGAGGSGGAESSGGAGSGGGTTDGGSSGWLGTAAANPVALGAVAVVVAAAVVGGALALSTVTDDPGPGDDSRAGAGPTDRGDRPPPDSPREGTDPGRTGSSEGAGESDLLPPAAAAPTTLPTADAAPGDPAPERSSGPTQPIHPTQPTPPPQPTQPTQPTPPPTSEPPVEVVPEPPVALDISRCGSLGSIVVPETVGVHYALLLGDGLEGRFVIEARALDGYVLAAGAVRLFEGDLGLFRACR